MASEKRVGIYKNEMDTQYTWWEHDSVVKYDSLADAFEAAAEGALPDSASFIVDKKLVLAGDFELLPDKYYTTRSTAGVHFLHKGLYLPFHMSNLIKVLPHMVQGRWTGTCGFSLAGSSVTMKPLLVSMAH